MNLRLLLRHVVVELDFDSVDYPSKISYGGDAEMIDLSGNRVIN